MKTVIYNDLNDILSIKDELEQFITASNNLSIFTTFDSIANWCEIYFENDSELFFITVYNADKIVSFAPLYISHNVLRFVCTGDKEEDEIVPEYQDIMVLPGFEEDVARCYQELLQNHHHKWQEVHLTDYLPTSFIAQHLEGLFIKLKWTSFKETTGIKYSLALPETQEELNSQLKGSFYRGLKSKLRKLIALGVEAELVSDLEQAEKTFASLCHLHNLRWQQDNLAGAFESEQFHRYHSNLLPILFKKNSLFLFRLHKDQEDISIVYGFIYKNTIHFYQSGYIMEGYEKYSLGATSHYAAMLEGLNIKAGAYDFMRGDKNSYKKRFKCQEEEMLQLSVCSPGLKNTIKRARMRYKKIRLKLKPT